MKTSCTLAIALILVVGAADSAPLKQMPIDFVGEWCNGNTSGGETNWQLPSWLGDDEKCTNILSVTSYDFSMVIEKAAFSCLPDAIRTKQYTAHSGTSYKAIISARCRIGQDAKYGSAALFEFHRYKGNIYIKKIG